MGTAWARLRSQVFCTTGDDPGGPRCSVPLSALCFAPASTLVLAGGMNAQSSEIVDIVSAGERVMRMYAELLMFEEREGFKASSDQHPSMDSSPDVQHERTDVQQAARNPSAGGTASTASSTAATAVSDAVHPHPFRGLCSTQDICYQDLLPPDFHKHAVAVLSWAPNLPGIMHWLNFVTATNTLYYETLGCRALTSWATGVFISRNDMRVGVGPGWWAAWYHVGCSM
jgi:hypothetical protein